MRATAQSLSGQSNSAEPEAAGKSRSQSFPNPSSDIIPRAPASDLAEERRSGVEFEPWLLVRAERLAGFGWFTWDEHENRVHCSQGLQSILGREERGELETSEMLALIHEEDRNRALKLVRQLREGGEVAPTDLRVYRADRTIVHLSTEARVESRDGARVRRIVGLVSDLTDRRQLESQLQQIQKTEALGELAAGVAHDFNNFLQIIEGHCELLKRSAAPNQRAKSSVREIARSVLKCRELARHLMAFGRKPSGVPQQHDVRSLLRSTVVTLGQLLGQQVRLRTRCGREPCAVRIDALQFEQVIVNLSLNARDAMPEGGTLDISVRRVQWGIRDSSPLGLGEGSYCHVTVRDTGQGIAAADLGHVLEPFFTTKPDGKGTGLGLSTVQRIVRQVRGEIMVESEQGRGTTVHLYFPISDSRPAMRAMKP